MKKVLLLEDRIKRQETYTSEAEVDLQSYIDKEILDNKIGVKYTEVSENLDTFIKKNWQNYKVIIAHESALKSINKVDILKEFCREKELSLVLFSGGINFSSYSNENYELLYLNSRDLYSKNLELFFDYIDKYKKYNLLLLTYGEDYKKNILLNIIDKIDNFFLRKDIVDPFPFSEFEDDITLKGIEDITYESPEVGANGWISLSELSTFSKVLKNKLIKEVYNV